MSRNAGARTAPPAAAIASPTLRISRAGRPELVPYLAGLVTSVLAMSWLTRLWRADLHVPFFYLGNDSTAVAAHAKTVLETGWYEYQPALGAPVGQHYHDFPTADNLHMVAFDVLGWFTSDFAVALNLYYLLGFPLAALTATYFLRQVGVTRLMTVALATLYAVAPYHFLRNEGHLFLASYYPLPLAMVVVLWIIRGEPVWGFRNVAAGRLARLPAAWRLPAARVVGAVSGRGAATVLMLGVLASASTYYAVFVVLLIAAAGLVQLARTGDRRRFVGALFAGLTTVAVVVANMLPDNLYAWVNGANTEALSRDGAASEIYALKIASLLLPAPGHPIPVFSMFRINYDQTYPVPSESPALGLIAAVGLLILLVMTVDFVANRVRTRVEPDRVVTRRETLRQLATLTLVALLFSTVGGLATVISFFSPNIRGWNRMTILIALLCLAAVGVVLDAWVARRRERRPLQRRRSVFAVAVGALVLAVGLSDQSLVTATPPYGDSAAGFHSDHDFVLGIEAQVTPGSMIFQLPFVEFPESPAVNGVADADQLKLYLNSTTLRWSAGGIRGRPQSDWPIAATSQGTATMVRSLATIGFAGIVTDRKRAGAADALIEGALTTFTGGPKLISADGRYAYFSLAAAIASVQQSTPADRLAADQAALTNPVMAYPGLQFNAVDRSAEGVGFKVWKSRNSSGSVPVVNDRGAAATVHLLVELGSVDGAPDVLVAVGAKSFVVELPAAPIVPPTDAAGIELDPQFAAVDQVVTVPAGTSQISLSPGPKTLATMNVADVRYSFHHLLLLDDQLIR